MNKKILSIILTVALVVSGISFTPPAEVDAAVHSSGGSGSWRLVWSDEFNQNAGTSPNGSYWQYDTGNGGWGNNEIQNYTTSTTNVAVDNVDGAVDGKALRITAKRENGQITSARIKSLDRQYVKYGKIEARIKMSNGMQPGVWPAFWMMGNDIHTNGMGWPLCGEIDIFEHRNQEREIISTLHWNTGSSYAHSWYGSELNGQYGWVDTVDNWHTYAVEWYEDCMKFFLDGNCYETIAISADMAEEFHKPHFILLNLAIGSTSTPFTKNTTVTGDWQQSSMYVDYVRVYQGTDGNFFRALTSNTSNIVTTASPVNGMTACAADGWYGAGSVWDYNMSTSWAQASAYYAGGSQNDFTIYMANQSLYEWGAMIRARQGVTPGHSYKYTINYNSDKAGSVLVKEDVSSTGEQTVGIVAGNGTINGSFTAGDGQTEAQILMDLRGVTTGTKLKITGLTLTDTTPGGGVVTTTQAPAGGNDTAGTTRDWSGIDFAGDGAGGGTYANKYKFYSNTGSLVNIQHPGFAAEAGLYVTFPSGISSCSLGTGNYDIQGAGVILHLSAFTAKETQFTITDATGTHTCYVYYADGTGTEVETNKPEETTTKAPSSNNPSGFTSATINDWSTAGSWGCYFGDWAGSASGAYQLVSDKNYKLYVETANTGADWLVQARYDAPATAGHTYRVTTTITTDKAGIVGVKEDISNEDIAQVYTDLAVGTNTVVNEFTVTSDSMRVMFELGRGITAGTTLSFDNIVIEDITAGSETPTEAPTEKPSEEGTTASTHIRTVHVNTGGATITKAEKTPCTITIMDKVGGDSYEDTVVYDTITSDGTIKLRGNSTSQADKKPYNISFSSKQNVFGMGKAKKWSLLANAFDKSLIRNRLAMELANEMGLPFNSQSTYADLYIDGKYMGNFVIIESVEVGSDRVDIDVDNGSDILLERERDRDETADGMTYLTTSRYGIRFAIGEPEGLASSTTHYQNTLALLNNFETALENEDFATVSSMINLDTFVDFYIVNELFKNVDFDFSSTRFYIKDGILCAGPLWDLDLSSGNALQSYYPDYYPDGLSYKGMWCQQLDWYEKLMFIPEFKALVADRYEEIQPLITNMINGNTGNSINALTSTYATAFANNYKPVSEGGAGWSVKNRDSQDWYSYAGMGEWDTYSEAVEFLRTWLTNRNTYLLEAFNTNVDIMSPTGSKANIDGGQYNNLVKGNTNATASASSLESAELPAEYAIDGVANTRWASAQADNQYFEVNLGDVYNVKGVTLLWEAASAATYEILVSTDGKEYKKVYDGSSSAGARQDDIVLSEMVEAQYIKVNCLTRTTAYGFSLYEVAVWGLELSALPTTNNIEINGFQISPVAGGIRTVYSVDSTVNGQAVTEVGLVYGIDLEGYSAADMYVGSTSECVYSYAATAEGQLETAFSKSKSYAMTMTFAAMTTAAYNVSYYTRAYAKLADGTYVYTDIEKYSTFEVASRLYDNNMMNTYAGHTYLYNNILTVVDPNYKAVDFNWGNTVVDKDLV